MVEVSSTEAAELTKLLENVFRSVNIALVNELAMLCDRMGIDVWEVVEAAATKPYGFMSFKPGPGMGGHCLPVDPFYLAWRAREFDTPTEFIELAGEVNQAMPYFCEEKIAHALNDHEKSVSGSRVAIIGVSYKPGVGDMRESPSIKIMRMLGKRGAELVYHDEHVAELADFDLRSEPRAGARRRRRRGHTHRASRPGRGADRRDGPAGGGLPRCNARDRGAESRASLEPARAPQLSG